MAGCDPYTTYFLLAISPQALLAYVAEGLFAPLILFLWGRRVLYPCAECKVKSFTKEGATEHSRSASHVMLGPRPGERRIWGIFRAIDSFRG